MGERPNYHNELQSTTSTSKNGEGTFCGVNVVRHVCAWQQGLGCHMPPIRCHHCAEGQAKDDPYSYSEVSVLSECGEPGLGQG